MPSGSWLNGWVAGDIVTAAELRKGVGCVFDQTVTVAVASIDTLAILPTTYAHMLVVCYLRGDNASAAIDASLRLNNDSGTNYDYALNYFNNATTVGQSSVFGTTNIPLSGTSFPGNTAPASVFGTATILIPAYGGTTGHKQVQWQASGESAAAAASVYNVIGGGRWKNTAAVNRLTLTPSAGNFNVGSRLSVYVMGA